MDWLALNISSFKNSFARGSAPVYRIASLSNEPQNKVMEKKVLHDFQAETIEEKTRWSRLLTVQERADILIMFTEIALALNPKLGIKKSAQPAKGHILVLSKA